MNFPSNYFCEGDPSVLGILDFTYLPDLLAYSFVPSTVIALLLSVFILIKDRYSLRGWLLFGIAISFTLWSFINGLLWIIVPANLNLFFWYVIAFFEFLIPLFLLYFVYVYTNEKDAGIGLKLPFILLFLLVSLLIPTNLNIYGFSISVCEGFVGPLILWIHAFSFIAAFLILISLISNIRRYRSDSANTRKYIENNIVIIASFIFLFVFTFANTFSEYTKDYVNELWGPVGINIFLLLITYLIVKYQAFNIKLIATQALVFAIVMIVGSMAFFAESTVNFVLISMSFVFVALGGYMLIRSVKQEVRQREQIEKLAQDLQKANDRLKVLDKMKSEFVSIASHQLRSPITAIRGYISMLLEGSYGNFPDKARQILTNISDSSKYMAMSIEDYLNVSRIEAGNMKYEMSEFNLKDEASKIADELRQVAMKKGLVLVFRSECSGSQMVKADIGKTRQVMINIIDNAIKYTQKGTITVLAHDDVKKNKIWISVHDTGIGMDKDTQGEVFEKFVRAKNANEVNVTGTGLGLFVAKKMISQMKGRVWAESEGVGKGSTFHIEFPMLKGKQNPSK